MKYTKLELKIKKLDYYIKSNLERGKINRANCIKKRKKQLINDIPLPF